MKAPEIEYRASAGVAATGRTLTGYAATYGVETRIGEYRERIKHGAFARTLSEGRDILALADHDQHKVLGRTSSGSLVLRDDGHGLHFSLTLPDTTAGRDVAALAQRGDLGGASFGFIARDETWHGDLRELADVELHEISMISGWPAYRCNQISIRAKPYEPQILFFRSPLRLWLETV